MAESFANESNDIRAIAGEAITKGEVVSICSNDGKMYLACAAAGSEELPALGVAEAGAAIGEMALAKTLGVMNGYTGLTAGAAVYVDDVPGDVSATSGATADRIGFANSDTRWVIRPDIIAQQTQH